MPDNVYYDPDTKQRIKDSLLRLLASTPKRKLSIKEIAREAKLNRGTFYLHYKGIDELISEIEEEALGGIKSILDEWSSDDKTSYEKIISAISAHLVNNRESLKAFLINDPEILPHKLRELMKYGYEILMRKHNLKMNEKEIEITISAVYGILSDWAVNESTYDISEFNDYLVKQISNLLEQK